MGEKRLGILLIVLTLLFMAGLMAMSLLYLSQRQLIGSGKEGGELREITTNQPLTQSFRASGDGLYLVLVKLKNVSIRNRDAFIFSLLNEGGEKVREVQISGVNIGDGEIVKFRFEPILDSQEKAYHIKLESQTIEKERAILAYMGEDGLVYRAYAQGSFLGLLPLSLDQFKARFMADQIFTYAYLAILAGLIIALVAAKKRVG